MFPVIHVVNMYVQMLEEQDVSSMDSDQHFISILLINHFSKKCLDCRLFGIRRPGINTQDTSRLFKYVVQPER